MPTVNVVLHTPRGNQKIYQLKQCWICSRFEEDTRNGDLEWVSPCKCRGYERSVHQTCVQRWVDDYLKNNPNDTVRCPQCNTKYIFKFGVEVNYFVQALNKIDKKINDLSPFLEKCLVVSTLYWSAVAYGAITVMQIYGEEIAITRMMKIHPYVLFLTLPAIPYSLILVNAIYWEKNLLLFVQRFTSRSPLLRAIVPAFLRERVTSPSRPIQSNSIFSPVNCVCAALVFPTTAAVIGKLVFNYNSYTPFKKTLLGGLAYIVVKGALRIYQTQYNVKIENSRRLVDYPKD